MEKDLIVFRARIVHINLENSSKSASLTIATRWNEVSVRIRPR